MKSIQWIVTVDLRNGNIPLEIRTWGDDKPGEIPDIFYSMYPNLCVISSRRAGFCEADGITGNPLEER